MGEGQQDNRNIRDISDLKMINNEVNCHRNVNDIVKNKPPSLSATSRPETSQEPYMRLPNVLTFLSQPAKNPSKHQVIRFIPKTKD